MPMKITVVVALLIASLSAPLHGQSGCALAGACNTTISQTLDFVNGACLDGQTRRYHYFSVSPQFGATITATAQSAFFAPSVQIISPSGVEVATNNNSSMAPQASTFALVTAAGTWFVRVRNVEVGTGGPYTIRITCSGGSGGGSDPNLRTFVLAISPDTVTLARGKSALLRVSSTAVNGFAATVFVSLVNLPPGVTVSPSDFQIPAPGTGSRDVILAVGDTAPGGRFNVVALGRAQTGETAAGSAQLIIDALCTSPFFLEPPANTTAYRGSGARVAVAPSGTPPFTFQWYRGQSGMTNFVIVRATTADLVTPPITEDSSFWARVSNECGSRDSATVFVKMLEPPPRRRAVKH